MIPNDEPRTSDRHVRQAHDEHAEMNERLARHDYDGALMLARARVAVEPHDERAHACIDACQTALEEMYEFAIGSGMRIPTRVMTEERVRALPLEPQHAFVLALVDGMSPVETIVDMTGLPRHVGLQALFALEKWKVLALR